MTKKALLLNAELVHEGDLNMSSFAVNQFGNQCDRGNARTPKGLSVSFNLFDVVRKFPNGCLPIGMEAFAEKLLNQHFANIVRHW